MIKVGTITYKDKKCIIPKIPGYRNVICTTKSSTYGSIGPYVLQSEEGYIMENIWQFSKVYESVPNVKQYYPRSSTVIWERKEETHVVGGVLTDEYWEWRRDGFSAEYPIRYPVGKKHRVECLYSVDEKGNNHDYVSARKHIYFNTYKTLVQEHKRFKYLKSLLEKGKNLLIIEVDGPKEDLSYYIENYGVEEDFIVDNTIDCTEKNMEIMLNDTKHPFGHGYCLAMCLLNYPYF